MWTKPRLRTKLKEGKFLVTWNKSSNTRADTPSTTRSCEVTLKPELIPEDKHHRLHNPPATTEYRVGVWDCEEGAWHQDGVPATRVVSVVEVTD